MSKYQVSFHHVEKTLKTKVIYQKKKQKGFSTYSTSATALKQLTSQVSIPRLIGQIRRKSHGQVEIVVSLPVWWPGFNLSREAFFFVSFFFSFSPSYSCQNTIILSDRENTQNQSYLTNKTKEASPTYSTRSTA